MFNIVHINFYVICIIAFIFCGFSDKKVRRLKNKNEQLFMQISFCLLAFAMMFRSTPNYTDYMYYIKEYLSANGMTFAKCCDTKAPLIFFASSLLNKYVSHNPQIFFMSTGFFILWSFFRWINKYSDNKYISVIVFVGMLYYSTAMNIVRQYVAIAILLWGYGFLIRNDRKWYHLVMFGLIVVIAFLCHTSAIAGVLWILATFIPVPRQRWGNFFLYGILYVMAGRGILFGLNLFYNEYGEAESYGNTGSNILGILVPLGIVMFVWLYQNSLKKYKILVNSAVISAIFSIYSVIGMLIVSRIGNYLSIFNILLIPKLIDVMFRRFDYKSRTRLAILMILIYYLVMIWLNKVNYILNFDFSVIGEMFSA